MDPTEAAKETIVEVSKLLQPHEVFPFVIILALVGIIIFKEVTQRKMLNRHREDLREASRDLLKLVKAMNTVSNQVEKIATIIKFLVEKRYAEEIEEKKAVKAGQKN